MIFYPHLAELIRQPLATVAVAGHAVIIIDQVALVCNGWIGGESRDCQPVDIHVFDFAGWLRGGYFN
jgi:hypothetical protein